MEYLSLDTDTEVIIILGTDCEKDGKRREVIVATYPFEDLES